MRWPSVLSLTAPLLIGCAGHATTMRDVRDAMQRGDLETARARLAEAGRGTDDLLFALEDGLLLFYAGDHELSNLRFQFAEQRVDDLYTKSITRAALSLLTSDLVLRFEPTGIDNFLVNYYRALNYLQLNQVEEALVEWRRLAFKLQFGREDGAATYRDPPFFNYLSGLGVERDDPNDAYISLRLAEAGYRREGIRPPLQLVEDLLELATRLGFDDHVEFYREYYGDGSGSLDEANADLGGDRTQESGEVVVLIEEGLVAPIEEIVAYLPIIEKRAKRLYEGGDEVRRELAERFAREYDEGRYFNVRKSDVGKHDIVYVMPLAFPVFGQGLTSFHDVDVAIGAAHVKGAVALEVSSMQRMAFEDRLLGIYAKTIARALVKYAAATKLREEVEEKHGEDAGDVAGFLSNLVNVATERADTRAWLGLPHRIWVARLRVPPGRHDVSLTLEGDDLVVLNSVEVYAGERSFVTVRIF